MNSLPDNTDNHLDEDARALLLRIARDQAEKAVAAALHAVTGYADVVRQAVESRLGVPAGDEAALDDSTYQQILDVHAAIENARSGLESVPR